MQKKDDPYLETREKEDAFVERIVSQVTETIRNVEINQLHDFKNHPFKVEVNTELCELMKSIEKEGVLVPFLVRTNPYGDGYEIISGHRRKEAAVWAGETKVPVVIRELDDDQAIVASKRRMILILKREKKKMPLWSES